MAIRPGILVRFGVALVLPLLLTACAGKVRLSAKTMCEAHGGSYSGQTKQCSYPPQQPARNVNDICLAQGGTYDAIGEACILENSYR